MSNPEMPPTPDDAVRHDEPGPSAPDSQSNAYAAPAASAAEPSTWSGTTPPQNPEQLHPESQTPQQPNPQAPHQSAPLQTILPRNTITLKKSAFATMIGAIILALISGFFMGSSFMVNQSNADIQAAQASAKKWKKQYEQQKAYNELRDMGMPGPNDSDDTGTDSGTSSDDDANSVTGLNKPAVNGGIEMKVLEASEQATISYDTCGDGCSNHEYAPKSPDTNTKYWVVKVEVKNNTSSPLDITCGYPYEIVAFNSKSQQYTPIRSLYQVEGNPECNAQLQPGLTSTVTYPFQTPADATMVGIGFRDVGDILNGKAGEDDPTYIITDDNYTIN
ncbi:hypothetical protein JS531_02485 [Bifidobacterium sp. CP2]|uniref:hypothetical protein n=1 Tax=Bifidobacterium sp. CP2 TaxID=2809025 RepID=UPI001BDDA09C|nr:hypothetical protein [Bifidobacterium sp. CP2]MBT1180857.1 hypothetical protein [Bifidobacterium sp. CP2]